MKLSLTTCAQWMGGELLSGTDKVVQGYSIDTRTLAYGELFFAVSGERHDAHTFVGNAMSKGAIAAVVSREKTEQPAFAALKQYTLIAVDDPLLALQRLGAAVRAHWPGTLVGITGSAGKTTVKEMVAAVLAARYPVLKSAGNLNNHFGMPLQLLRLEPEHRYAVIEMGMSHAGEIALLASLARPDWAVITNVGMAHAGNFSDGIEGVARAKRELVEALPAAGIAFLNADDARVAAFASVHGVRSVLAGRWEEAEVRAVDVEEHGAEGIAFKAQAGEETAPVRLRFVGSHNIGNALLALAVGREAGIPLSEGAAALAALTPGDKRGELLEVNGARLINDCYNSNPAALSAMIDALMQVPGARHILVAGEMLELGSDTGDLHAHCGEQAARAGVDWVIGVQGAALALAEAAAKLSTPALFFEQASEAGDWLRRELRPGDAVLLKGSRGVRLEKALDVLLTKNG